MSAYEFEEVGSMEALQIMADIRKRHAEEDEEEKANLKAGEVFVPRPAKLYKTLEKHERHLNRDVYPHSNDKNNSIYADFDRDSTIKAFEEAFLAKVHQPVVDYYIQKKKNKEMTYAEAKEEMDTVMDKKCLEEIEILNIHNIAPKEMEPLQTMIEEWEDRFTLEDMQLILDVVMEVLRPDELKERNALKEERKQRKKGKKAAEKAKKAEGAGAGGAISGGQEDVAAGAEEKEGDAKVGLAETAKMGEALR